ncbi:alpha/beta fold hydrolase [Streptomyces sp. T028]|uniref:alpha/beta fold hydrolase n=1 Tax=Streptomyces sp. T028 TaxID=3394379 RepID=UPI003A8A31F1
MRARSRRTTTHPAHGTGSAKGGVIAAGPEPVASARAVVLVPGTNTNGAVHRHIAAAPTARRPTGVLDVPGQPGLSAEARPRRGRSVWYGRWLTEVLEQAAPGPALVVGHSLGGAIVPASGSPRIAVLLASAGPVRLLVPPAVVAATVPWLARPTVPRAPRVLGHMVAPGGRVPEELAEWMALVARLPAAPARRAGCAAAAGHRAARPGRLGAFAAGRGARRRRHAG